MEKVSQKLIVIRELSIEPILLTPLHVPFPLTLINTTQCVHPQKVESCQTVYWKNRVSGECTAFRWRKADWKIRIDESFSESKWRKTWLCCLTFHVTFGWDVNWPLFLCIIFHENRNVSTTLWGAGAVLCWILPLGDVNVQLRQDSCLFGIYLSLWILHKLSPVGAVAGGCKTLKTWQLYPW